MNNLQIVSSEKEFKFKVNGAEIEHITGYEIRHTATSWSAHVKLEFEVDGRIDVDLSTDNS